MLVRTVIVMLMPAHPCHRMWHSFLGSPHGWEVDFIAWFVSPPKQGLSHYPIYYFHETSGISLVSGGKNPTFTSHKWLKKSHLLSSETICGMIHDDPLPCQPRPFQRDATPSTRLFRVTRNNCRLRRRGQKAFRQLHCHGISWLFSRIKLKAMYIYIYVHNSVYVLYI